MTRNDRHKSYRRRILILAVLAALLIAVLIGAAKGDFAMFGIFDDSTVETVLDERYNIDGVQKVNLDVTSLTVEVLSTPEDQVRLVFQSNLPPEKRAELAVERNGDTFTVEQLQRIRIGIFLNVREKLTVYLPARYQAALSIGLRSGHLTLLDARSFSDFSVNLTSGNLEIGDITADRYDAKASSGNMTLGNWHGSGQIQLTSGNIRMLSLSGERHDIKASSGNVKIGAISGALTLRVTSGTMRIEHFTGSGTLSSASGGINLGIDGFTGDINLDCTSGTIRATVPQSAEFLFDAEVLSGSVKTDFSSTRNGHRTTASVGASPRYTLHCHTTSGSVRVGY